MSLYIEADKVTRVMIGNEWHEVKSIDGISIFDIDSYEIHSESSDCMLLLGGGSPLIPAHGFMFLTPDGRTIYGPLTSVQAIETRRTHD